MIIQSVTDQNFVQETSEGFALLTFYTPSSGSWKMLFSVLEEIDAEIGDRVRIVTVNVTENEEIPRQFDVMSVPAIFILKDGKVIDQTLGYKPKEALIELLAMHI